MSVVLDFELKTANCTIGNANPQTKAEILNMLRLTASLDAKEDASNGQIARHAREGLASIRLPFAHYLHVLEIYQYDERAPTNKGRTIFHTISDIMVVRIGKQEYSLFLSSEEDLKSGTWSTECLGVEKSNRKAMLLGTRDVARENLCFDESAPIRAALLAKPASPAPIMTGNPNPRRVVRFANTSANLASTDYENANGGGGVSNYDLYQKNNG